MVSHFKKNPITSPNHNRVFDTFMIPSDGRRCYSRLFCCSWSYSPSTPVNWCHLATVITILTDLLMEHCKCSKIAFPYPPNTHSLSLFYTHMQTHTRTHTLAKHIVLTPLAGKDIQPSSAVAVLVSITVSVRQKAGWGGDKWTDMISVNTQLHSNTCFSLSSTVMFPLLWIVTLLSDQQ